MKNSFSFRFCTVIIMLCAVSFTWAEKMPAGYYDAANGKKDADLKSTLSQLIRGGKRYNYGSQDVHSSNNVAKKDTTIDGVFYAKGDTIWKKGDPKFGTWSAFPKTDIHADGTIWDMYSSTRRYFPILGGSAAGMDIEHSFPKSWWGGDDNDAYKDLYHLCPADRVANNNKSNFPPGILQDSSKVNNGYFFMGKDTTWGGNAFCVCDEYKGDFARAYFYIATAYEDFEWKSDYTKYINHDSYLGFVPYLTEVLLQWHRIDPVSEKEINRLDAISSIQHNRNPFIEYPELVEYIWGNKKGQNVQLSKLTLTTSTEYEIPISSEDPKAYEAKDIWEGGFLANWSNVKADSYTLDVYAREESGKFDTLVAMPGFKNTIIKASDQLSWLKPDNSDAPFSSMDGSYATCMSTTSEIRHLTISNFGAAPANTKLDVKCCVFKGDLTASLLVIDDDNQTLYEQPLVLDECVYTFDIPQGTKSITLQQTEIGKTGNYHRISLQQAFLYHGDYTTTKIMQPGFPMEVQGTEYNVLLDFQKGTKLYYQVHPKNFRSTNEVMVIGNGKASDIVNVQNEIDPSVKKYMMNNVLIIEKNGNKYSVLGQKLH